LSLNLPNNYGKSNIFTGQDIAENMIGPLENDAVKSAYQNAIEDFETLAKENGISNYIFFFDASNHNVINNNGDFSKDLENGIYHITLNSGSSIIKKINFSRLDMPGLREGLAVQEGSNKNLLALKQAYKIEINFKPGVTIYKPGDIIFVRPYIFFGNQNNGVAELSQTLGFVGYYMITGSKYSWGAGKTSMESVVSGKLIAWINSDGKAVSIKGN